MGASRSRSRRAPAARSRRLRLGRKLLRSRLNLARYDFLEEDFMNLHYVTRAKFFASY